MTATGQGPWTYRTFQPDTPAMAFGPFAGFLTIWRGKCPGPGVFPSWRDFELMDFEGWWGQVSLGEIQYEPFDLRWVLWGTVITNWWGVDYTNKYISQISAVQDVWENQEREYLQRLLDKRLIGHVTGSLSPQERKFYHICGVDLPLENDGVIMQVMSLYRLCEPSDMFVPSTEPVFVL
jgi:hypothetical protein